MELAAFFFGEEKLSSGQNKFWHTNAREKFQNMRKLEQSL